MIYLNTGSSSMALLADEVEISARPRDRGWQVEVVCIDISLVLYCKAYRQVFNPRGQVLRIHCIEPYTWYSSADFLRQLGVHVDYKSEDKLPVRSTDLRIKDFAIEFGR